MFVKGQSGNPGGRPAAKVGGKTINEIAREHTPEAIKVLVTAMRDGDTHTVKLAAANSILDRGWGRPAQSVTLGGDKDNPLVVQGYDDLSTSTLREIAGLRLSPAGDN